MPRVLNRGDLDLPPHNGSLNSECSTGRRRTAPPCLTMNSLRVPWSLKYGVDMGLLLHSFPARPSNFLLSPLQYCVLEEHFVVLIVCVKLPQASTSVQRQRNRYFSDQHLPSFYSAIFVQYSSRWKGSLVASAIRHSNDFH